MSQESECVPSSQLENNCVILAVSYSMSYLGVAIYDQSCTTVRLLNDAGEDHEFTLLKALVHQEEPTTILCNKAQDIHLVRFISQMCSLESPPEEVHMEGSSTSKDSHAVGSEDLPNSSDDFSSMKTVAESQDSKDVKKIPSIDDESDEDEENDYGFKLPTLIFMPNNAYNFESGYKRISELFAAECFNESENQLVTRFRIDTSCRNMVRALGALLKYMDATRIGVEYEPLNVQTPVTAVKTITVGELLEIDSGTYLALDIFSKNQLSKRNTRRTPLESQPSSSLFSLCNKCRSGPGRQTLRKWFERPTTNLDVLSSRQEAISFFLQDCNLDVAKNIRSLLGCVSNVKYILNRMRSGTARVRHWENLFKTISNSVAIGRYLETLSSPLTLLNNDVKNFGDVLAETAVVLSTMIDFEESYVENRVVMNLGVDPELDRTKQLYRQLPGILTRVAQEECHQLKAETCSVAYVPLIGYLLALPLNFPVEQFKDLEVIYTTETSMNVKSEQMRKLDEELGDVKMKIIDKETTITIRMSALLLSRSSILLGIQRADALLDAAISLAFTARQLGWNRPKFVEEPIIEATRVAHPLAQLGTEKFVTNPVSSGGNYSKIKVLTGPNASGKSVYLKQVGLLVYLAHIGSFVPAEVAHIGTINRIVSRIYTVDSILDGMSTFAKDLDQISISLRRGNQRSLVIIDEFGKGTMTEVGLSLLASSVSYWAAKGQTGCPHVFIASHFHALSKLISDDCNILSYHTMEVLRRGAELDFQYRLVDGLVESSFATYTATKMGVPADVVDRANQVYEHVRGGCALSEITIDYEDKQWSRWLAQQLMGILTAFETWDIDSDPYGLLDLFEKTLFEPSSRDELVVNGAVDQQGKNQKNDEITVAEDISSSRNHCDDHLSSKQTLSDEQNGFREASVELEESVSSLTSALRQKKKTSRCNLSVSFALDTVVSSHVSEKSVLEAVIDLESKEAEKINRIVIADSDDDVSLCEPEEMVISSSRESDNNSSRHVNRKVPITSKRSAVESTLEEVILPKRIRSL